MLLGIAYAFSHQFLLLLHPIRNIGWNNALVEMAQQSRVFVRMYSGEHLRLVAHIKRLGFDRQLGDDSIDAMLNVVASGGEWPDRGPLLL